MLTGASLVMRALDARIYSGGQARYVGHATEWDSVILDGDLQKPEFIALYVKAGRVDAVAGWDRDQDIARRICLFEQRREWQADALLAALAEGR